MRQAECITLQQGRTPQGCLARRNAWFRLNRANQPNENRKSAQTEDDFFTQACTERCQYTGDGESADVLLHWNEWIRSKQVRSSVRCSGRSRQRSRTG